MPKIKIKSKLTKLKTMPISIGPTISSSALSRKLDGVKIIAPRTEPVWKGPKVDGVSQSLLGRYLCCKERFRLYVMEGWKTADKFTPVLEFGNLWHMCEKEYASQVQSGSLLNLLDIYWEKPLQEYALKLVKQYSFQREEIIHWYTFVRAMFPMYVDYWAKHPDVQNRTPLLQEQTFNVPYALPSGRVIKLRGKWDSVDIVDGSVIIQENKTKSGIDPARIGRQVTYDLQSMIYVVALNEWLPVNRAKVTDAGPATWPKTVSGIRYNVVKRSSHKSVESLLKKIGEDKEDGRIGEWFARWNVEITPSDVTKFKHQCLDPVLDNITDDYEWWAFCFRTNNDVYDDDTRKQEFPHHQNRHFRYPYGIYNPMLEGGTGDLDGLLNEGTTAGLQQVTQLFPELEEIK